MSWPVYFKFKLVCSENNEKYKLNYKFNFINEIDHEIVKVECEHEDDCFILNPVYENKSYVCDECEYNGEIEEFEENDYTCPICSHKLNPEYYEGILQLTISKNIGLQLNGRIGTLVCTLEKI
jgi:rubrerythrin